jgi:protein-tyrosine phosphatase
MPEAKRLRICLVCTGNTCRSPMSEGLLKALAKEQGLDHWQIESGGLSAFAGAPASPGSVIAALEDGVDIRSHRASVFTLPRARECDLILVHSGEHYHHVLHWSDDLAEKTYLLRHFPGHGDPGPEAWVADPIGLELSAYVQTYRELKEKLRRIVPQIRNWAGEEAA